MLDRLCLCIDGTQMELGQGFQCFTCLLYVQRSPSLIAGAHSWQPGSENPMKNLCQIKHRSIRLGSSQKYYCVTEMKLRPHSMSNEIINSLDNSITCATTAFKKELFAKLFFYNQNWIKNISHAIVFVHTLLPYEIYIMQLLIGLLRKLHYHVNFAQLLSNNRKHETPQWVEMQSNKICST